MNKFRLFVVNANDERGIMLSSRAIKLSPCTFFFMFAYFDYTPEMEIIIKRMISRGGTKNLNSNGILCIVKYRLYSRSAKKKK